MTEPIAAALEAIRRAAPNAAPDVGIVLGSGLGPFARRVEHPVVVSYADIPGFPAPGVAGHAGRLVLGRIFGASVAILDGRAHFYEHGKIDAMKVPIRTLAALGCRTLLLTNAAGSLRADAGPGSIMMIVDHINLVGLSPLFGETGSDRFVDMTDAYDPKLQDGLRAAAKREGIRLHEGVYMWFAGPQFETPAEIRAASRLGADAVGMSTVPEVIVARLAGMKVGALSIITNMAAGLASGVIGHRQTLDGASKTATEVERLLSAFLADRIGAA